MRGPYLPSNEEDVAEGRCADEVADELQAGAEGVHGAGSDWVLDSGLCHKSGW